jgi:hypothetical protein
MYFPLLFFSHSGEDTDAAKELAAQLRRAGLRVWLDVEELKLGDRWMQAIEADVSVVRRRRPRILSNPTVQGYSNCIFETKYR